MKTKAGELWNKYKKSALIFAAFLFLGIAMEVQDSENQSLTENRSIRRPEAGEGERTEELTLRVPEMEEETEYSVAVPERMLTEEERKNAFDEAEEEIDLTFPGNNTDLDHVTAPVVVKNSYGNGLVEADWLFSDYTAINTDGTLVEEAIPEDGCVITATVTLSCQGHERIYEFLFRLCQRSLGEKEKTWREIDTYLKKQNELEGEDELKLPDNANGMNVEWEERESHNGMLFLLLGAFAAFLIQAAERQKVNEKRKKREHRLMIQYPEMVNKLSLLLGAGMTMEKAWEKVTTTYAEEKEKRKTAPKEAYEEMQITLREIRDGMAERTAYERFGERCAIRPYRKLSALIVQNLRKGSRGLTTLMEAEAEEAFEQRKNLARKLGEEAGTKLLFPMMMSLGVIIVIIMLPAVISFYKG